MTLEQIIRIADEAYPSERKVAEYFNDPDGNHGDTLAKFIAIELRETYEEGSSKDQLRKAYNVMAQALEDLESVVNTLYERYEEEEEAQNKKERG